MSGIRRAFYFSSLERYLSLVIGFGSITIVSRLLTPTEIGTSAIGIAVIAMAISLKEFAASGFLIQGEEVERTDIRTAFTIQLVLTLLITTIVVYFTPDFADFYGEPTLRRFIQVMAATLVLDTFAAPVISLLRRDLAFHTLAVINVATICTNTVVAVGLAAAGFSVMSIAWASLLSTLTTVLLSVFYRPDFGIFRPSVTAWRRALAFGGYNGTMAVVGKLYEAVPQLVLGRVLPLYMVGLYNRATVTCGIADKLILSGAFNVAFPALAAEARAGRDLKAPLLTAFCYVTAFYWPTLALVGLLAHPLARLILGAQWDAVAPLIQIMAVASLAWFPVFLTQPLLLAVGAMRHALLSSLIGLPLSAFVLCGASYFGVEAMAASQLVTTPFQMYVALSFARRHVPFSWKELALTLRPSAGVSLCSVLPLALVSALVGFDPHLPLTLAILAACLSLCGWVVGIRLTGHPIGSEIHYIAEILAARIPMARLVGRFFAVNAGQPHEEAQRLRLMTLLSRRMVE
jgi:O-antigen/teichoic acid export membrane protein